MGYYNHAGPAAPTAIKDIHGVDVFVGDRIRFHSPAGSAGAMVANMGSGALGATAPSTYIEATISDIKRHSGGKRAGVVYLMVDFNPAVQVGTPGFPLSMKEYAIYPRTSGKQYRIEKI